MSLTYKNFPYTRYISNQLIPYQMSHNWEPSHIEDNYPYLHSFPAGGYDKYINPGYHTPNPIYNAKDLKLVNSIYNPLNVSTLDSFYNDRLYGGKEELKQKEQLDLTSKEQNIIDHIVAYLVEDIKKNGILKSKIAEYIKGVVIKNKDLIKEKGIPAIGSVIAGAVISALGLAGAPAAVVTAAIYAGLRLAYYFAFGEGMGGNMICCEMCGHHMYHHDYDHDIYNDEYSDSDSESDMDEEYIIEGAGKRKKRAPLKRKGRGASNKKYIGEYRGGKLVSKKKKKMY